MRDDVNKQKESSQKASSTYQTGAIPVAVNCLVNGVNRFVTGQIKVFTTWWFSVKRSG